MATLPERIRSAERALAKQDPVLGAVIKLQAPLIERPRRDYFFALTRSIVGQQVSVAAAAAIFGRLDEATALDPKRVLKLKPQELRAVGLSLRKAEYIRDLAEHFVKNPDIFNHLGRLPDERVIEELTAIRGIGVWTAQMFLMFTLVRLDVFAPDDIGLQRAIKVLYGKRIRTRAGYERFATRWKPYRTVASWHLWESLDNTPG